MRTAGGVSGDDGNMFGRDVGVVLRRLEHGQSVPPLVGWTCLPRWPSSRRVRWQWKMRVLDLVISIREAHKPSATEGKARVVFQAGGHCASAVVRVL